MRLVAQRKVQYARRGRTDWQRPRAHFNDGQLALGGQAVADIFAGAYCTAVADDTGSTRQLDGTFTPPEGEPRFARQVLWRAAVEAQLVPWAMAIAGHFVNELLPSPVSPGSRPGSLPTNLICDSADPSCFAQPPVWTGSSMTAHGRTPTRQF